MITRRNALNTLAAAALTAGVAAMAIPAKAAEDTIKVGVLHSLSGTMAISETTLKDSVLPVFEELNGMLLYI
jgi:urea transport system substrate-binding protein